LVPSVGTLATALIDDDDDDDRGVAPV